MVVILMIISSFFCFQMYCEQDQEIFLQANNLYKAGQYQDALNRYQLIPKKGRATWFNMGNCHYKIGSYIDALICWKRSEKGATSEEVNALEQNYAQVQSCLGGEIQRHTVEKFSGSGHFVPFFLLQLIALFLVCILTLCIIFFRPRILWILVVVCIGCLALCSLYLVYDRFSKEQQTYACIMATASVHAGPDERYHVVDGVSKGNFVAIGKCEENWIYVKKESTHGWIKASNVVFI